MPPFSSCRSHFPALQMRDSQGRPAVYFDGAAGTQVPQTVIDAMTGYLIQCNANTHGAFATSRRSDEIIQSARTSMADFLNAPSPEQIVFGANMTSLTYHLSRSIAKELQPDDEIIVTRLDHDANICPWLALEEQGVVVRFLDFNPEDCMLDYDGLGKLLSPRTRLVAVGYASNAVGTINDIPAIIRMAHDAGALVYVDAVHYAPHGPIDVQQLDCDFLVCSAYKFFGPHVGALYGKPEILARLPAYKVRPQENDAPFKFETGTLNHEGLAGVAAAIDYLADIGRQFGASLEKEFEGFTGRRLHLKTAMAAIREHERRLVGKLIAGLQAISGTRIFGITAPDSLDRRTPTVGFRLHHKSPLEVAEQLGRQNIYVWDGNFYALEVTTRLGVEPQGGVVRIGLVHYNTEEEIDHFLSAMQSLQ